MYALVYLLFMSNNSLIFLFLHLRVDVLGLFFCFFIPNEQRMDQFNQ